MPYPGFASTIVTERVERNFGTHTVRLIVIDFGNKMAPLTVQGGLTLFDAVYEHQLYDEYVAITPFVNIGRFQGNLVQLNDILQNIVYLSLGDNEVYSSQFTNNNMIIHDRLSVVVFDDSLAQKNILPAILYIPLVVTLPSNVPYITSSYCEGVTCDVGENGAIYLYEDSIVLISGLSFPNNFDRVLGQSVPSVAQRYYTLI